MYYLEREIKQVLKERKFIYKKRQFQRGLRGDYYSEKKLQKPTPTTVNSSYAPKTKTKGGGEKLLEE